MLLNKPSKTYSKQGKQTKKDAVGVLFSGFGHCDARNKEIQKNITYMLSKLVVPTINN
jgi:hypothetical protein